MFESQVQRGSACHSQFSCCSAWQCYSVLWAPTHIALFLFCLLSPSFLSFSLPLFPKLPPSRDWPLNCTESGRCTQALGTNGTEHSPLVQQWDTRNLQEHHTGRAGELLASPKPRWESELLGLPTDGRAHFCHGPWGQQLLGVRVCYVQTGGNGGAAQLPHAALQQPG